MMKSEFTFFQVQKLIYDYICAFNGTPLSSIEPEATNFSHYADIFAQNYISFGAVLHYCNIP